VAINSLDTYPAPDSTGIAIGDSIKVFFDQEMDESSINSGTFVLAAPNDSIAFGPGLEQIEQKYLDDRADILTSDDYLGYVSGTITFARLDSNGATVSDSEVDYDGDGDTWRTVAIFTPNQPLEANIEYTVILAGDEDQTNDFDSGVKSRSIFDAEPISVSGTGYPTFHGTYTGSTNKTYVLEITGAGATGAATYQWWNKNTPLEVNEGLTTTGNRELEDGIIVSFSADGSFTIGDQWEVVVKPYTLLAATYSWTFESGSGSITTPTSTYSASGIESISTSLSAVSATSSFYVSDIDPAEGEYGVEISESASVGEVITITFTDTIDQSTVDETTVSVRSDSPNGDSALANVTGDLDFTVVVATNTITITLGPAQLYENNIVIITLDKTIADEDGNTLGTDYVSYFATTYNPLYIGLRRVMLDIGSALPSDIKDETIYLAILIASLQANALTFSTTITNATLYNLARAEYTACLAERMLVSGMGLSSDRLSKTLGDLSVSRGSGGDSSLKDELASCMVYWENTLKSGGGVAPDTSIGPQWSVKGGNADDAITVGRLWEPTTKIGHGRGAANTKIYRSGSTNRRKDRTYRTRYNRGGS